MTLKLFLMRAFYKACGRGDDKRQTVRLRTAVGTDNPADIADVLKTGATEDASGGPDIRYPDENPLYVALMQKKFKAAEALAKERPEWLAEKDGEGQTMLHRVALKNNGEAVEFLADRGMEVETKDSKGVTPMMLAVHAGSLEAAVALAGVGAKLDLKDPQLEKALRVATSEMDTDFLTLIGRLKQEEVARDDARVTKEITALRDGTTRDVPVRTLRLQAQKGAAR